MAIEQTLLASGKRVARLLIQNPEQIKLWQLFKALGKLEKTAADIFVPAHETLRQHVIVLEPLKTGQKGLGFFKRLWATLRLGLSKLWVAMDGPKDGKLQAFAHIQKVLVPVKTSITETLKTLEKNLYSLAHISKTGTKQHELGHAIMGYLTDRRFQEIVLDRDIAKDIDKELGAFVSFKKQEIKSRHDLLKRLLMYIGGDASINQPFKKAMDAVKSLNPEAYLDSYASHYFGATHDFHQIQQLLLKYKDLLTPAEREALETLKFKDLQLDKSFENLSKAEWTQLYQDCKTLLAHPLVDTVRHYAATILDSIPTEAFNRMTVTMTPLKGNKTIRGFIENALTREKLQELKSKFIDSLLSEKGPVYEQLHKQ